MYCSSALIRKMVDEEGTSESFNLEEIWLCSLGVLDSSATNFFFFCWFKLYCKLSNSYPDTCCLVGVFFFVVKI